jgi:hypothetical protein
MKQLAKYLSGVSLLALLVAAPLAAQGPSYGGLTMKAGLSYGDVSNSGVFPGGARTRSGAALGIGILSGGPLGFGIEALYAQRGIIGAPGSSRELDYIDLPFYLRLAAQNPALEPFAYVGPQVSFELKCDANGGACPSGREKVSYAGAIGAGVRLASLRGLSIEGRYVYGLSDLELGTVSDSESYKTRSFMVLFGFGF